jgi:acyl phosphate:glycerol-3-phosphate acyltransferase
MDAYFLVLDPPLLIAAILGACAVGYLLGSIPFGLVITKLAGLGDIRTIGSGNIGATNVLRTGRKDLALATLLLDAGKAGIAFFICLFAASEVLAGKLEQARAALPADAHLTSGTFAFDLALIGGAAAFIGHCFPLWLKFKGGKGVATFIGLLLASMWQVGLLFALTWVITAALFRMSSFAALLAALMAPVFVALMGYGNFAIGVTCALVILIFWLHRANISRILAGAEPKIGKKKAETPPPGPTP